MGNTPYAREAAYVAMVEAGIAPEQQLALTNALIKGWALGDEGFVADLQTRTQRRVAVARAGRPVTVPLHRH
jgi:putative transposase